MHIAKLFRSVPFHNITVNIVKNKFTKKNQYASIFKILCATCTKKSRLNIVMTGKYMNYENKTIVIKITFTKQRIYSYIKMGHAQDEL